MSLPRLILCNGATIAANSPVRKGRHEVRLATHGDDQNINLKLQDVAQVFLKHLNPRLVDLLEIAAFVYAADASAQRGRSWTGKDEYWTRGFHYVIPVRDLAFWSREDVCQALESAVSFLAGEAHAFQFVKFTHREYREDFLDFGPQKWPFEQPDRVMLFSGGLDSLAGALDTASAGKDLVLVSHRPVAMMSKHLKDILKLLRDRCPVKILHIPVWVNKNSDLNREYTQRTRSLLFSALAVAVAQSLRAGGVRFFENGPISINLPLADEVVGSRATRTTHPRGLELLSRLYRLVTERQDFVVDNPYLTKTKTDVVSLIASLGHAKLIGHTVSCTRQMFRTRSQAHCSTCSQCIDRRIAVFAAGQEGHDLETDYVSDVFTGPRKKGPEQRMAVNYVRHVFDIHRMSEDQFATRYTSELARATRHQPNKNALVEELVTMHMRHAAAARDVLIAQHKANSARILDGELDRTCLLALAMGGAHRLPLWRELADRIVEYLRLGLPRACQSKKPANEPHLQEICDAILAGHDLDLEREFPFCKWGLGSTKPDWSREDLDLWVELKYIRKKDDVKRIGKDIAEDITKYGDNGKRVIFVVYDPLGIVLDPQKLAESVSKRPDEMHLELIR